MAGAAPGARAPERRQDLISLQARTETGDEPEPHQLTAVECRSARYTAAQTVHEPKGQTE
ncbi:hypothetical protein PSEUDO9AG_30224 [Pseudomonas sp. 9Ag]|nr:hypothetical protein PSEUDO9AG_30224 [Pseudomonas sp. 9Ag]